MREMRRSSKFLTRTSGAATSLASFALLLALPHRFPFLEESANAFNRVLGVHQLFQTKILSLCKAFVEVHGIPGVERFLSDSQGCRAELEQATHVGLNELLHLVLLNCPGGQADLGRLTAA